MQKNAKNKNGLEPVYKPYLKGNAVSGLAAKRGLRVLGMIVLFAFLFMIVSVALSIDNFILRLVINLGMVAICCWMMFAEGSRQGENDDTHCLALGLGEGEIGLQPHPLGTGIHPQGDHEHQDIHQQQHQHEAVKAGVVEVDGGQGDIEPHRRDDQSDHQGDHHP